MHIAVYAGSFDPVTLGHLDVLRQSRGMFDKVIVAIGNNPEKPALFSFKERLEMLQTLVEQLLGDDPGLAEVSVESYEGLTVDFASKVGACAIIRGIRNVSDVADECQLAITNRQVAGIETIFIVTGEAYAYTSSSLIKQITALGGKPQQLSAIVPDLVIDALIRKQTDPDQPLSRLINDPLAE